MRYVAVYFGTNTILATVFHPENAGSMSSRGSMYLQTMNHTSEQLDFMITAVGYSVWLFVSEHFCPTYKGHVTEDSQSCALPK